VEEEEESVGGGGLNGFCDLCTWFLHGFTKMLPFMYMFLQWFT
jgi:hypothetical protein